VQTYHQKEFTAKEQNYWSQQGVIAGEWQGRLAGRFGLAGRFRQRTSRNSARATPRVLLTSPDDRRLVDLLSCSCRKLPRHCGLQRVLAPSESGPPVSMAASGNTVCPRSYPASPPSKRPMDKRFRAFFFIRKLRNYLKSFAF